MVFFCSSIPVVLFDNPGISKCLSKLFLLSPHLCFIKCFTYDLLLHVMNVLEYLHTTKDR